MKLQNLLPHHLLSALMGLFLNCSFKPLKNWQINRFVKVYKIELSHALKTCATDYRCFNDFFSRQLKPELRPIAKGIVSPADGLITETGTIAQGTLIQAKNFNYSLQRLLTDHTATLFMRGFFMTFYLSPRDYHRAHSPLDGELIEIVHVPGRLFSVNQKTINSIPEIYTRNERVIFHMNTYLGRVAVIMVGALLVGSIQTSFVKLGRARKATHHPINATSIKRGDELGLFKFGSTVIVLLPQPISLCLTQGTAVKMGQQLCAAVEVL